MNKSKNKMRFLAEPDDAGGGTGVAEILDAPVAEPAVEPAEPVAPAAPTVDAAELAKQFATHLGTVLPKPAAEPQQKQLTPEEIKKLLNVWEPDDAFVAEFGNLDTQKSAIAKMRDALIKQADTIAQVRLQELQAKMMEQFNPALQFMQQHQQQQREARFGEAYPQLAEPKMKPLIAAVAQDLATKGKTFDSEESLFKALATGVEAVIQVNTPEFKIAASAAQPKPKGQSPNALPNNTSGSGGGGGNAPAKGASGKGRALSILGDVAG